MHGIVEAANLLEDVATCDRAYELLAPFAHLPVVTGLGASCFGTAHHTLGVAALTSGRLDEAVEHFRSAIDGNLALGHWPALRISRLRYAEALTRRGRSRDADTASDQLAAADRDAVSLGLSLPSPAEPIGLAARCTREGRLWRVQLGAHHALVEHCIGMLHLAVLLANPESEIPAMDLAAGVAALGSSDGRTGFSAQPVLDRVAAQQYRQRLSQVNAEIEDHDPERSARARAERDWIVAELAAGTGLGGRPRHVPDSAERARLAVGKAIRRAIARIDAADPVTGGHLRRSVHTGVRCWYLPA
jgi:hypothetical protein